MIIQTTQLSDISSLRKAYFNSLPLFQELFLEIMIPDARAFLLEEAKNPIGYCIVSDDNALLEFYLVDLYMTESHSCFRQLLKVLSISDVYCKSFDSLLLNYCLTEGLHGTIAGLLYRDYHEPLIQKPLHLTMRKAQPASVSFLSYQDASIHELFENEEQLTGFIQKEHVFEFYEDKVFIGCGMVIKTHPEWQYCDLGVWVEPTSRGRGLGAQIILYLREYALQNQLNPSCGCAIDNLASQRTIEKSGFISHHKMLHFTTA
jgi:RimJ/RimL family protein N-acetyltransferase